MRLPGEHRCSAQPVRGQSAADARRLSRRRRWPRRRLGASGRLGAHDLVGGDLLEADAQRLAGDGADLRRDHVAEAVAELAEVRVDLPGTAGGERDQAELRVDACRGAPRSAGSSSCRGYAACWSVLLEAAMQPSGAAIVAGFSTPSGGARRRRCWSMIDSISSTVRSRSSLTTTWSAIARPIGSSSSALRTRWSTLCSGSPRPRRRRCLLVTRRWQHEDQDRFGVEAFHLAGAVDLDLEHRVASVERLGVRACRSSCRGTSVHSRKPPPAMRSSNASRSVKTYAVVGFAGALRRVWSTIG